MIGKHIYHFCFKCGGERIGTITKIDDRGFIISLRVECDTCKYDNIALEDKATLERKLVDSKGE